MNSGPARPSPRIAIVIQGDPLTPASWSGTPAGLASGLEAAGCEVVGIDARFPGAAVVGHRLRMSWADQTASRIFAAASSVAAGARLRAARGLDGAVAIGSGYRVAYGAPFVTFEDMTVAQALELDDPVYRSLGAGAARRWRERQRRIYERSAGCCVASEWAARSVRDEYGIVGSKVHVVGFGRNVDIGPVERDWTAPRFLWVGADWERKRGSDTLAGFATVRERHPEATLDLVGNHPPIDAAGVTGHGRLALDSERGREEYSALISRATCFLMPSTYEPFGIAYLDAAATGLPSIGTTVGGAAEAVGNGGLVVDPGDPRALPDAMLTMSDPTTAREIGERALRRADLFTWRAVAERVLRTLRPPGMELDSLAAPLEDVSPTGTQETR